MHTASWTEVHEGTIVVRTQRYITANVILYHNILYIVIYNAIKFSGKLSVDKNKTRCLFWGNVNTFK